MKRWLCTVVLPAVLQLPCSAVDEVIQGSPCDLRSLVTLSKSIVLAKQVSSQAGGQASDKVKVFVVVKVYKGSLLPGMRVEASAQRRSLSGPLEEGLGPLSAVVLFLEGSDPYPYTVISQLQIPPPAGSEGSRFVAGDPIQLAAHERSIEGEILNVEAIRTTFALSHPVASRQATLDVITKLYEKEAARRRGQSSDVLILESPDALLVEVAERLTARGDQEGVLELIDRTQVYQLGLEDQTLLLAAQRPTCPTRLRVVALRALDPWFFTRYVRILAGLADLTRDPVPEVRQAAMERLDYAHRRYHSNAFNRTTDLDQFWAKAQTLLHPPTPPSTGEGTPK